jgi:mannose-6-phosphate isomerase-like protein (cupin superfamily)
VDVSESDNATAPQVPPLGRGGLEPDATAPDGSEIRLLLDERHHAHKASMVEVGLPAGQVSRPVRHRQVEEVWYVLEGRGQVWRCPPDADPKSVPPLSVAPGDALSIPTGWSFQFSTARDASLRFLCVTIPPWPGEDEAVPAAEGGLGPPSV